MSIATTPQLPVDQPAGADRQLLDAPKPRRLSLVPTNTPPAPVANTGVPRTVAFDLGVPTVHRTVVDFANFDHAATSPALVSVQQAVERVQRTYGSVHRGAGYASQITTGWFEQARTQIAQFVDARADDQVVFTRNTTDALRLLAHCVPRRARVFAWESAHHAALLPWSGRQTHRLPVPDSAQDALELLRSALAASAARDNLVVITGACNVTGEIWPVNELIAVAKEFGARTVIDAAQLAPHRAISLADLDTDWVAFSGHKTYAPYGAGVLVGRRDWLDAAAPYLPAGGATRAVAPRSVEWQTGPARHEGGTPNAVGAIALAAACAAIEEHRESIELHEQQLSQRLRSGLAAIDRVTLVHALGADRSSVGVVTFVIDGIDCSLVSQALADEHGIAVRDGRFCAHLLCDQIVGGAGCAVRASVGLATEPHHVQRLIDAVAALVQHGPSLDYEQGTDGIWRSADDPRDLTEQRPW